MNKLFKTVLFLTLAYGLVSCGVKEKAVNTQPSMDEDSLLTLVQYQTFQYFWEGAEPVSGMACERIHMDGNYPSNDKNVVTSGGSGFGLMAILVGVKRGFITQEQAVERLKQILDFLDSADRFHGVYPHWWYGDTGKVKPFSKKDDGGDLVETSFLAQGLITVREFFKDGEERERLIAERADKIWRDIEFDWHTKGGENVLYWHWSPNYGWDMNFPVGGYNECLIMYVLAASSPTHGVDASVYHQGWARNGQIKTDRKFYGYDLVLDHFETNDDPVGPLFWAHYSYLGLNPKGLKDEYGDYWTLNRNHALVDYEYCLENPKGFKGYGENCWGLTSSYSIDGYAGHSPSQDLSVISPTAALSSIPYTPKESLQMIKWLYAPENASLIGKYGPYDAFSLEKDWLLPHYLAIDQGPIPVMIENYRTGFIWDLFMSAPEIKEGLNKLGFSSTLTIE